MNTTEDFDMEADSLSFKAVAFTMTGVLTAIFMGMLDQTVVATAIPSIVKSLNGFGSYSGIISSYLITSTVTLPVVGRLSDAYGRKKFLIGGIIWFMAASLMCGFATSITELIIFRAVQGIGAGTIQAAANTTIADLFPPARRGRAIGFVSTTSISANIIGPLLGGLLTDTVGWRYAFFINVPVGFLGLALIFRFFPQIKARGIDNFRIDYLGVLTLISGVTPVLLALDTLGNGGSWASFNVSGLLALGLILCSVFIYEEKISDHPIVPVSVFKDSIISLSLVCAGLLHAVMYGVIFFIPLFMQSVLGTDAKTGGAVLIPFSIAFSGMAALSGNMATHFNRYKIFAVAGMTAALVGLYLLFTMGADVPKSALVRNVIISGIGVGAAAPLYNLAVQNAAPLNALGITTSMVYFTRTISASVGVAVYGTILSWKTRTESTGAAIENIFELMFFLAVAALAVTMFIREIPLRKSNSVKKAGQKSG